MNDLPEARSDGMCADCLNKAVVTTDRRFCRACLKKRVAQMTPMIGCYVGLTRGKDHRQDSAKEPSPWQENAVRDLEDSTE